MFRKPGCLALAMVSMFALGTFAAPRLAAAKKEEKMLIHNVFFTLKDGTPENAKKLVEACKKHLPGIAGIVYFAAGNRIAELKREVNDTEYHVGLHVVFRDKAAHDKYQDDPDHLKFIAEAKDLWKGVKVFDNSVEVSEIKGE